MFPKFNIALMSRKSKMAEGTAIIQLIAIIQLFVKKIIESDTLPIVDYVAALEKAGLQ